LGIDLAEQGFILALEASQECVDQAGHPGLAKHSARLDRGRDGGMWRCVHEAELIESDQDQRLDVAIARLERAFEQTAGNQLKTRQQTQCAIDHLLHQGLIGR
jgi:hypothetical protein